MVAPTVLSLFAGIGGIDLGLKRAGFRTACYCENDPYAVRVLQARMDGSLDEAPVWDDVRTFDGKEWRDEIDLIAGGFPCQDLSFAGKRAGINGSRSGLWAEMFRAVCEVRPRLVLVENVPGILVGGLGRVLGDLASIGYDATWTVLSAAAVGAPHLRRRVFIVAHPHGDGCDGAGLPNLIWEEGALPTGGGEGEDEGMRWPTPRAVDGSLDAPKGCKDRNNTSPMHETLGAAVKMWPSPKASDSMMGMTANCSDRPPEKSTHLQAQVAIAGEWTPGGGQLNPAWVEWLMGLPIGWTDPECACPEYPEGLSFGDAWAYDPHPAVPRVAKGIPDRAKRLRCLGNAVVPQCAERIGKRIRVAYR